ncbi:hypothetical protein JHK82_050030 [Glycine max]|nr:hypothetical protein JHK82_050030 [Glycine max]
MNSCFNSVYIASKGTTLSEAEQEQSNHALTVAIASAVVAEAVVTAAHAAAEVVHLTGQRKENSEESQPVQTAFRGYLVDNDKVAAATIPSSRRSEGARYDQASPLRSEVPIKGVDEGHAKVHCMAHQ